MRTIEEMFEEMKKIAREEGYKFNPNKAGTSGHSTGHVGQ